MTDVAKHHKSVEVKAGQKKDTALAGYLLDDRFRFWMTSRNLEDDKLEMEIIHVIPWVLPSHKSWISLINKTVDKQECVVTMLVFDKA